MNQLNQAYQPFLVYPGMEEKDPQQVILSGMDYNYCGPRIIYRLIHAGRNLEILEQSPHIPLFDLAVAFYILVSKQENGIGSIRITNHLMETWGVDTTCLLQRAQENTPRIFPSKCCSLRGMLESLIFRTGAPEEELLSESSQEILVLTNQCGINGASVWLYPGLLSRVAARCGDFYILPSSIHELLIVPQKIGMSPEELSEMVYQVNRECVEEKEFLSDHVYLYERKADRVRILL